MKRFLMWLLYRRRWEKMRATAAPYSPAPVGTWDYQPRRRRAKDWLEENLQSFLDETK